MSIEYLTLRIQNLQVNVFTLGGATVLWKFPKQTCIARSMMESEFIAIDKAKLKVEWIQNSLNDILCWPKSVPTICIHYNNQSIIKKAQSSIYN
jgi:hypothetical protein